MTFGPKWKVVMTVDGREHSHVQNCWTELGAKIRARHGNEFFNGKLGVRYIVKLREEV